MKKFSMLLTFILGFATVFADNIELRVENDPNEGNSHIGRSCAPEVIASINGRTLTLDLTVLSDVEYIVTDVSTGIEICYGRFLAGATTEFDLPDNVSIGTYRLEVYAYGCWWTGTFQY